MNASIRILATKFEQPIGYFYVSRISAPALFNLAKADIRRITSREMEQKSGIQRGLKKDRVQEIAGYIRTVDAAFPNSLILNLNSEYLESAPRKIDHDCDDPSDLFCFEMIVAEQVFQIIDGQHRLSGFEFAKNDPFDLIIAFFIDLPIEDQAYLFSTINVKQVKVNKSHVYDLFDVSETRSPQRTAHLLTKALNVEEDSPLYRRIKLLGIAPQFGDEVLYRAPLSQGTVASRIEKLISENAMEDRDLLKRGEIIPLRGNETERGLIFRKFFAEDKDWAILRILKSDFRSLADVFVDAWADHNNLLAKTIGYGAMMRLLVDAFRIGEERKDLSYDFFLCFMETMRRNQLLDDEDLTFDNFAASGSGETKLYRKLREWAEIE